MNSIATSEPTSRQKRVRTDPTAGTTTIDLTSTAASPKTNRSPTKSAIQTLEDATASLPTSLHPLVLHFGNKLISICAKRITKENIAKRMTREPNYIPKSAKASDFKITLSKGASEDGERVSFLEQQIQQAKDTYESSLKSVIEECTDLETAALISQENNTIYTLLPAVAEAINTLEGISGDVHQKVITLLYLDSSFLAHTTSNSRDSFITSYCAFHSLDPIPSPTIHPLTNNHASATERDAELLQHTKSLQKPKNKGLQTFRKAVECIIIMPSASFESQIDENNKEIALKKLSNEIIFGKTTETTAMELDAEGGASFEQLQELIRKNAINGTRNIDSWRINTTNFKNRLNIRNRKKTCQRGAQRAPQTKRNRINKTNKRHPPNADVLPHDAARDQTPGETEKSTVSTTIQQTRTRKDKKGTDDQDRSRRKSLRT